MRIFAPSPAKASQPSTFAGLPLALLLAVLLVFLSYSRLYGDSQSAFFHSGMFTSLFAGPIWGTTLAHNLIVFACAQFALHLAFGTLCWALARVSWWLWPSEKTRVPHHVLLWFLALTFALLANNAGNYPHGALGEPYAVKALTEFAGLPVWAWIVLPVVAAVVVTLGLALRQLLVRHRRSRKPLAVVAGLTAIATTLAVVLPAPDVGPVPTQPNVILIGLDSLRSDIVFPEASVEKTPHLKDFMSGAVGFSNAMTPLARTFPSMTSILTGRRPHSTGAIINLLPRDLVREGDTLPRVLGRAGYNTAYATDEVRLLEHRRDIRLRYRSHATHRRLGIPAGLRGRRAAFERGREHVAWKAVVSPRACQPRRVGHLRARRVRASHRKRKSISGSRCS